MNYPSIYRVTGVVAGCILSIMLVAIFSDTYQLSIAQNSVSNESLTIRKTATSVPGAQTPGHEDHQIVMATPPLGEEKLWVGKVSWISSEPIEVGFRIGYNQSATDMEHSNVETIQKDNRVLASANLTGATPQKTFGTMDFVTDQLVFHSTNNTKFTVTYAMDAVAKDITNIP
jgi:maltodextrin utilization protein YvdJ